MAKHAIRFNKEHYEFIDNWNLSKFKEVAESYAKEWGVSVENITFNQGYSHSYYDCIDLDLEIKGYRLETDEEEQTRLAKEKEAARKKRENAKEKERQKEARDIAEFARLKEKFKNG